MDDFHKYSKVHLNLPILIPVWKMFHNFIFLFWAVEGKGSGQTYAHNPAYQTMYIL